MGFSGMEISFRKVTELPPQRTDHFHPTIPCCRRLPTTAHPGADIGGLRGPGPPRRADGGGRAPSVVDFGGGPKIVRGDPYVAGGVKK